MQQEETQQQHEQHYEHYDNEPLQASDHADEEEAMEPSHIVMASAVAAPMSVRPSPPRAVHINGSSSSNNNKKKKRVPPPKMTEDEALEASGVTSSSSSPPLLSGSPSMEKDRFAALLALGVAHQQQQLHQLTVNNRPSTSRSASSSSTVHVATATPSSSSSHKTIPGTVEGGTTDKCHTEIAMNPTAMVPSSSSSSFPYAVKTSNGSTTSLNGRNAGSAPATATAGVEDSAYSGTVTPTPTVYIRPPRSGSTDALVDTASPLSSSAADKNNSTILQQHRLHPIPGLHPHSATSQSIGPSTAHTSTPGIPNSTATSGTGSTSNKMAALAAKWGSSASAKLHSISSSNSSNSRTTGTAGSSLSSFSSKSKDHTASSSSHEPLIMSGIAENPTIHVQSSQMNGLFSSDDTSASPMSHLNNANTQHTGGNKISLSSASSIASSSTASTYTGSNKQSSLHGHGKEAISKAVNIATRLRNAASNKMRDSSNNNHSHARTNTTILENEEIIVNGNSETPSIHLNQQYNQKELVGSNMTKSSSLRSLSSFGNVIKQSSPSNLRKFSPSSFSSSSSSSLSTNGNAVNDTGSGSSSTTSQDALKSSNNSSGSGSGIAGNASRRLGLHRATPSSLSTSLGLTHRQSPLSSSNSLSTSNASQSNNNNDGNSYSIPMNRSHSNTRYKNILGVNVPIGRAGEVFGAPLNVAADRTRLMKDLTSDEVPFLNGLSEMDEEQLLRRKEASFFLPAVAIRCLDYLNEYGKTEEGLYRIPGSTLQISNLRQIFDAGQDLDLISKLDTRVLEPSAVASCFKLWLRELPESLLHNMEREIDILLLEHTGNAASSKVTMAQAQSPSPPNSSDTSDGKFSNQQKMPQILGISSSSTPVSSSSSNNVKSAGTTASPLVIKRIKDLFANNVPKENVILLREISYHLAHLASFSNVTKMTFANLRLILSPTLRLSPVMLSLLVNEREQIFPKPGAFLPTYRTTSDNLNFNNSNLDLSLPATTGTSRVPAVQPKLTLSLPGEDGLPPIPPSKSPIVRHGQGISSSSSSTPPTVSLRTPFSSADSNWTSFSSPAQSSLTSGQASTNRKPNASNAGCRASWHVIDLPTPASSLNDNRKDSSESTSSDAVEHGLNGGEYTATPIAKKFLNQRASLSNLLDSKDLKTASPSSPAPSEAGSRRSVSSNGSNVLARTPTLSGRSPSPFFSSGAPPAALGFMATHSRKRSSASSFSSIVSNSGGAGAIWRTRKVSPQHDQSPKIQQQKDREEDQEEKEEEEELSHSDTNTSICSSASSAKTPKDQYDLSDSDKVDGTVQIAISRMDNAEEEGNDAFESNASLDTSRRATITAESFGQTFARKGQGRYANSDEMKRKRGSVMILNMPNFS